MNNEQEIAKFRAFLDTHTADNFNRSSAIQTFECYPDYSFNIFIAENIDEAKSNFDTDGEEVEPYIVLVNAHEGRIFEAYHDENNAQFLARITREARDMNATMVFISMLVWTAPHVLDIDATSQEEVAASIARGDVTRTFGWYAERNAPGEPRERRSGFWSIEEHEDHVDLGVMITGIPMNAPLFQQVLDR